MERSFRLFPDSQRKNLYDGTSLAPRPKAERIAEIRAVCAKGRAGQKSHFRRFWIATVYHQALLRKRKWPDSWLRAIKAAPALRTVPGSTACRLRCPNTSHRCAGSFPQNTGQCPAIVLFASSHLPNRFYA